MDIISIFQQVGSYRGTAAIWRTTPKTVKRVIVRAESGGAGSPRKARVRNYASVADLVAAKVASSSGRISAKRLLPAARAGGFSGSARNLRRLVAGAKVEWRRQEHRGRRPAVWAPGEYLVIDWGTLGGVKVFCAVLAWSRVRFVRFAADEQATTTMAMLAECFEVIGGVPAKVLADRMGCLKGGVVANVVVPTGDYVAFAAHYGVVVRPCPPRRGNRKGVVEKANHVAAQRFWRSLPDDVTVEEAQVRLDTWCARRGDARIRSTPTGKTTVGELAAAELLRPVPTPFPATLTVQRVVSAQALVSFRGNRYSVPPELTAARVSVIVRLDATTMDIATTGLLKIWLSLSVSVLQAACVVVL